MGTKSAISKSGEDIVPSVDDTSSRSRMSLSSPVHKHLGQTLLVNHLHTFLCLLSMDSGFPLF